MTARRKCPLKDCLANAMAAAGLRTKKATVDEGSRRMASATARWRAIEEMAGLGWEGDLDAMRRDSPNTARR